MLASIRKRSSTTLVLSIVNEASPSSCWLHQFHARGVRSFFGDQRISSARTRVQYSKKNIQPQHISRSVCTQMVSNPTRSFYRRILPDGLVDLSSGEGKKRFKAAFAAGTAEAFFPLVSQYQTQSHPALCGLTTLTIMLNALQIDPGRVWMNPWRWFAETLLDCCLDLDSAKVSGITMDQLAQTATCNGADVEVLREISVEDARQLLRKCVSAHTEGKEEYVAVAYDRQMLGQTGLGHFSPVAAVDEETGSVLILDTARFKVSCIQSTRYSCMSPFSLPFTYTSAHSFVHSRNAVK